MAKQNVSIDFRLKKIDETRNYLLEKIKQNDLMSQKHKKASGALNCFELFLVFVSAISRCVWISAFASLVGVPIVIASYSVGLNTCAITARIEKNKSIIKEKKKMHNKIVLLAKTKLNIISVLISKALIDSYINHDKLVSANNLLREYSEMKEEIRNPEMLQKILYKNNENVLCQW